MRTKFWVGGPELEEANREDADIGMTTGLQETGCGGWTKPTWDTILWWALANTKNRRVSQNVAPRLPARLAP